MSARVGILYIARVTLWNDGVRGARSSGWKVGFTTNLRQRLVTLARETFDTVEIVAMKPGPQDNETEAHRSLRLAGATRAPGGRNGYGVHGCAKEWYRDTGEFRSWLDAFSSSWRGSISYPTPGIGGGLQSAEDTAAVLLSEVL